MITYTTRDPQRRGFLVPSKKGQRLLLPHNPRLHGTYFLGVHFFDYKVAPGPTFDSRHTFNSGQIVIAFVTLMALTLDLRETMRRKL